MSIGRASRWTNIDRRLTRPAAVMSDLPANVDVPRVVPTDATITKVGGATIGYDVPVRRRNRMPGWQMNAFHRRADLQRVALYRRANGLAMGPATGWAFVIGNTCRVLFDYVTAPMLIEEAEKIGCGSLDAPAVDSAVQEIMGKAWGRYRLWSAAQAGAAIELTSIEREEAGVTKIDAFDEPAAERRRRQNRERMRKKRAASAALPRVTKKEIAAKLGIGLRTVDRMIQRGDLPPFDAHSVRRSIYPPYYFVIDPRTKNTPTDVRTKNTPTEGGSQ